jgi:hypothetical protein
VYTTQWQEIAIGDLRSRKAEWPERGEYEILWEGKLTEIRIVLGLVDQGIHDINNPFVQGPDEVPEAVEIDWIKLTGVEEQLQGELSPPPAPASIPSGTLFTAPLFYPLGVRQVGSVGKGAGSLGDLDGDGYLDLVAYWEDKTDHGWLVALNDGKGGFIRTQVEHFPPLVDGNSPFVGGEDLDGDGRMDLVLWSGTGKPLQTWMNDPDEGWRVEEVPDFRPLQVIDLDKDGDEDLWGWGGFPSAIIPQFLVNDGKGDFSVPVNADSPGEGYYSFDVVYPTTLEKRRPLAWVHYNGQYIGESRVTYQNGPGELLQESLPIPGQITPFQLIQAGDFNLDGYVDLITSDTTGPITNDDGLSPVGLNVLRNRGDGRMDTMFTFPNIRYTFKVQVTDVNRDGIADIVVWSKDIRTPSIVVLAGQGDGRFVKEGQYPLPVGRGGPTLSGDLDNDGDVDLVVFDNYVAGGGGVHVFLSRLANQITAVEEEATTTPVQSHLGAAYPNPFNPGVVIPFTLEPVAEPVALTIYNTLGQEVRKLKLGALPAGAHQVEWDGRNEEGKVLSSGVYVYRLEAGGWSASGKMVKSE